MRTYLFLFVGVLALISCQKEPSPVEKEYYDELKLVLDGHDELMKEMATLNTLIQHLDRSSHEEEYRDAIAQLQDAHDQMFSWMHDFNDDFPDPLNKKEKTITEKEYKEKLFLLKQHQSTLEDLENQFDKSINQAKELLN